MSDLQLAALVPVPENIWHSLSLFSHAWHCDPQCEPWLAWCHLAAAHMYVWWVLSLHAVWGSCICLSAVMLIRWSGRGGCWFIGSLCVVSLKGALCTLVLLICIRAGVLLCLAMVITCLGKSVHLCTPLLGLFSWLCQCQCTCVLRLGVLWWQFLLFLDTVLS